MRIKREIVRAEKRMKEHSRYLELSSTSFRSTPILIDLLKLSLGSRTDDVVQRSIGEGDYVLVPHIWTYKGH